MTAADASQVLLLDEHGRNVDVATLHLTGTKEQAAKQGDGDTTEETLRESKKRHHDRHHHHKSKNNTKHLKENKTASSKFDAIVADAIKKPAGRC